MEIGWIDTPEEWRDFLIMCYAVAGTIMFLVAVFFTVVVGYISASTVRTTRRIMRENVVPTLESVRETSESVRGTVGFISDNAVAPVIKAYGTFAGARRFVAVVARFASKRGD